MRNPIRLKNLNARFAPLYVVGLGIVIFLPPRPEAFAMGLPPILLGVALRSWGAGHLVKNHALTMTGPYAHLRHPLYLGTLLVAMGFALLLGGWSSLVALVVILPWFVLAYFPRKDRIESSRLEALYGTAYAAYHEAVPALWPRLQPWRPPAESPVSPDGTGDWALSRYSDNNELGALLAIIAGVILLWLRVRFGGFG